MTSFVVRYNFSDAGDADSTDQVFIQEDAEGEEDKGSDIYPISSTPPPPSPRSPSTGHVISLLPLFSQFSFKS